MLMPMCWKAASRLSPVGADPAALSVISFRQGPFWNFSYLLGCPETRKAIVIDPAWDVDAILRAASACSLQIEAIVLTHSHSDHVNGVAELAERTGVRALIHAAEGAALREVYSGPLATFEHEESFALGRHRIQLVPSPGHSLGSIVVFTMGHLFSGDTLHVGGPGRPGHYPGAVTQLWASTRALLEYGPETVLHPGHDEGPAPPSTLAAERERSIAQGAVTPEAFAEELRRTTGRAYEV